MAFLHHVVWNRQHIIAILVHFSNFVWKSQTCSARTVDNAFRPVCHTVVALHRRSYLAHLEALHFPRRTSFPSTARLNGLNAWFLLQVGVQRLSIRMRLELMNQLLDCFLAGVIMLLDGRMAQSLDPEVNFSATTFVVRSTATSFSVLVRMVKLWSSKQGGENLYNCSVFVCVCQFTITSLRTFSHDLQCHHLIVSKCGSRPWGSSPINRCHSLREWRTRQNVFKFKCAVHNDAKYFLVVRPGT